MINSTFLKCVLCAKVASFTDDEMYEFLTNTRILFSSLCEKCSAVYGECPETHEKDDLCKERFRDWCQREADTQPVDFIKD